MSRSRIQDIGIATFLMLLWKDTYGPETIPPPDPPVDASAADAEPWRRWPRPPGGFVDLGCGNGLLTHILISEGYTGHGFDLRARTSWTHYPPSTQSHLLVRALDPTGSSSSSSSAEAEADTLCLLPAGCFLIGNHADELTPWVPILATRFHASGYLSIPCCAWALDARFDRARDVPLCVVDAATLNLGDGNGGGEGGEGEGGGKSSSSSYALYRVWLAALSVHCGWAVEVEVLRIPSTRNWAIVGEHTLFHFAFPSIIPGPLLATMAYLAACVFRFPWAELDHRPETGWFLGRGKPQHRGTYRKCAQTGTVQDPSSRGKSRRPLILTLNKCYA